MYGQIRNQIGALLIDPHSSFALKAYLSAALDRDPVDVLGELELLHSIFEKQFAALVQRRTTTRGTIDAG